MNEVLIVTAFYIKTPWNAFIFLVYLCRFFTLHKSKWKLSIKIKPILFKLIPSHNQDYVQDLTALLKNIKIFWLLY